MRHGRDKRETKETKPTFGRRGANDDKRASHAPVIARRRTCHESVSASSPVRTGVAPPPRQYTHLARETIGWRRKAAPFLALKRKRPLTFRQRPKSREETPKEGGGRRRQSRCRTAIIWQLAFPIATTKLLISSSCRNSSHALSAGRLRSPPHAAAQSTRECPFAGQGRLPSPPPPDMRWPDRRRRPAVAARGPDDGRGRLREFRA